MSNQPLVFDTEPEGRASNEERRATVRYRSTLSACCRTLSENNTSWRARVRDVSALGIGLALRDRLEPGRLIEIDLERTPGNVIRSLLARVVHVQPDVGSDWMAGCAFTTELSEAHLRLFRAERVLARSGDNRRWIRFPCNVETVCYTCETTPGERAPARVLDISPGGIGLILPCQFPVGIILNFELPRAAGQDNRKLLVRVVRSIDHDNGDWFHGCEFAQRLRPDEVDELV
jgi:hypothetical protein